MKNVLKLLGQFLIGAVIGLGFVWLMIWLIDGENMFSVISNGSKDVKAWKVALSCLCTFTSLIIAVVLNFALHETGHLLGGLATGFNFLSIRLFKYALVKDEDGLHLKKFNIAGTGGQCLMDLPENIDAEKVPYFWYNAGGFLVNLLIAVISVVLLANFDLGMFGDAFFFMMAFVGFACFLMNALPVSFNGMQNDGSNILTLWRDKSSRKYFYRVILMAGRLSRGVRAKDIPLEWYETVPVQNPSEYFKLSLRVNYIAYLEDCGRLDEARQVCEELDALGDKFPALFRMETSVDHILLELLTSARREVVARLLTKQLQAYIKANLRYSAMKSACLYALALLYNNDKTEAERIRAEVSAHRNDYIFASETATAEYLMDCCDKKQNNG